MSVLKSLVLGGILITGSIYGQGFGFNIGPFDMQFNAGVNGDNVDRGPALDNPMCDAISNQQQLELVVEGREIVNAKELKIVQKKLIVEPYAFGVTRDGAPVLRGKVVSETLVKEVTVKTGEDRFNEQQKSQEKEKGYFSGIFSSSDKKNIDIGRVINVQLIDDSHFDVPKDFKGLKEENVRVICQLPLPEENPARAPAGKPAPDGK